MELPHNKKRQTIGRSVVIGAILLVTLLVRIDHAAREVAINPDVVRFIELAKRLNVEPLRAVRDEVYHPLHAALTLAVHWAVVGRVVDGDARAWVISTKVVGIAGAVAVCWIIMRMARRFGAPWWAAAGAGLLWAVGRRSSGYGADGLSDMLCLALFGFSMLAGMSTRLRWRPRAWLGAGALAGLSYLARPEGVAAVLILAVSLVLYYGRVHPWRWIHRKSDARQCRSRARAAFPWSECAKCLAMLALGFAVIAGGYVGAIGRFTGKKPLFGGPVAGVPTVASPRASSSSAGLAVLPGFVAMAPVVPVAGTISQIHPEGAGAPRGTWELVGTEILETFGFAPCLVVGLALPLRPRLWGRPHWRPLVFVWIGVWLALMVWLIRTSGYLDGRHTLALELALHCLFALALPLWGKPMQWWQDWWRARPGWASLPAWRRWNGWPGIFSSGALVLGCLPGAIMLYVPPAEDRGFVREGAAWLQANASPNAEVVAENPLLWFYSGLPHHREVGEAQMADLAAAATEYPLILACVFQPGKGEAAPRFAGGYEALQTFVSAGALHGDTLVLYARRGSGALRADAATRTAEKK